MTSLREVAERDVRAPGSSPGLYRAGTGEPLVLLHAPNLSWHIWQPVLPELVARYEVIAPNLPGHPHAPEFHDPEPSIAGMADVFEKYMAALGIEDAHLAGISGGGTLAMELAKRGRARSVVAIGPVGGWPDGSADADRIADGFVHQHKLIDRTAGIMPAVVARPLLRRYVMRNSFRRGELVPAREVLRMAEVMSSGTFFATDIAMLRGDRLTVTDLDRVAAPVLLAWPEFDRVVPKETCSQRFRAELPSAEYRVLPGLGHLATWDDAQLVAGTIIDWITRAA